MTTRPRPAIMARVEPVSGQSKTQTAAKPKEVSEIGRRIQDVSYHVALELTPEQVRSLKLLATSRDESVKDFVSGLVKKAINSGNANTNKKEEPQK